jgi:hypothetical protein
MKLTIARLRSGTNYKEPLHDIMDSFYYLFKEYMVRNPQHDYGVCNFGWGAANRKKLDDIADSDVILIPSENEFFQHIKGYVDQRHKERSDEFVNQIGGHLHNKHVVIVRSDRADNEELYRKRTFAGHLIGKFSTFDEMDIPGGLHGMKYFFIRQRRGIKLFETERNYDFVYWGCDKRKLKMRDIQFSNALKKITKYLPTLSASTTQLYLTKKLIRCIIWFPSWKKVSLLFVLIGLIVKQLRVDIMKLSLVIFFLLYGKTMMKTTL